MRKLILLSSVFMLSFGVFVNNDAHAISGFSTEGTLKNLLNEHKEFAKETAENIARLAEQNNAGGAKQTEATGNQLDALSTNSAITAQQTAAAGVMMSSSNSADLLCFLASDGGKAVGAMTENAKATIAAIGEDLAATRNLNKGSFTQNGLIDSRLKLIEMISNECSKDGNNGANASLCQGTGNNPHLDAVALLNTDSLSPTEAQNNMFAKVALTPVHESIPKDLIKSGATNEINILAQAQMYNSISSIAHALYANTTEDVVSFETTAVKYLRERMEAGGYNQSFLDELFKDGLNFRNYFEANTFGSNNPAIKIQKTNNTEKDLLAVVISELQMTNQILTKMYERLGVLNLGQAGIVTLGVEERMEQSLNPKIRQARGGQ